MINKTNKTGRKSGQFEKVRDGKGKPIRGLWKRGQKYYAQVTLTRPNGEKGGVRVPLNAANLSEAREAYRKLLVGEQRRAGSVLGAGTILQRIRPTLPQPN